MAKVFSSHVMAPGNRETLIELEGVHPKENKKFDILDKIAPKLFISITQKFFTACLFHLLQLRVPKNVPKHLLLVINGSISHQSKLPTFS